MGEARSCRLDAPGTACQLRKPDAGRRLATAQVTMFEELGATVATSFEPFGGIVVTDKPVVLMMGGQEGDAAGGDHWAPAQWEAAAPAPDMVEVDAGWP